MIIVFLFWIPAGIFLHGYYQTKYSNPEDLEHNLDRDMKTWAPVLVLVLALVVPESYLLLTAAIGIAFEGYLIYSDETEGAVAKFRRYLDDD